jgi:hypothetical protein
MFFSAMLVVSGYAVKDIAAAVAATVKNKTENRATVCCRHDAEVFAMKPLEGVEKGNLAVGAAHVCDNIGCIMMLSRRTNLK